MAEAYAKLRSELPPHTGAMILLDGWLMLANGNSVNLRFAEEHIIIPPPIINVVPAASVEFDPDTCYAVYIRFRAGNVVRVEMPGREMQPMLAWLHKSY